MECDIEYINLTFHGFTKIWSGVHDLGVVILIFIIEGVTRNGRKARTSAAL